ncbi:Ankyrin repeat family protein [Euphorbia peplus]|nr:Ankyrin repeat family protein [Euphorbia peplus]
MLNQSNTPVQILAFPDLTMQPYSDLASSNVNNPQPRWGKAMQPSASRQESLTYHQDAEYVQNLPLYKAVDNGDLEGTIKFLEDHPNALTASLSADGDTALHVAVLAGHEGIVQEIMRRLGADNLAIKNKRNATALNYAAIGEMVRYLYNETPKEELSPQRGKNGIMLLTTCIIDELFDIALDLLQRYPELAFDQDSDKDTALDMLAKKHSAFFSGTTLALWQTWVYSCIRVHHPEASKIIHEDIERPRSGPTARKNIIRRGCHQLLVWIWQGLKPFIPAIKYMYNLKLKHTQANELLCYLCNQISTLHKSEFERLGVEKAIFNAVKHGIVEFIVEMIKHYPDIIWCEDDYGRNILLYATLQRQEKIFSLVYKMGAKKNAMATSWDKYHNNILHQAAYLAPSSQLDRVSGAALQMQRELLWFKEVESIVQPKYREMQNIHKKTPQTLFSETHKRLVEEGEKWMKDTAESCTVVAALIATIMFSAIFTAPGGYNQYSGEPLYLYQNSFMVFIVSDAISLFASSSSLLMFLGILTSRYREEDFLKSLPTKLIIGLSTLFFSIATMMVTFGVTLVIFLRQRISWVTFPIILLASLPVTLFALLQFPVLVDIFFFTYGPGIFDKSKKRFIF